MKEEWRDIPNYEGLYQVSNLGRVKSLARKTNQTNKNRHIKEKILRQRKQKYGYTEVTLRKNNKRVHHRVHRLVMLAFTGSSELPVNHIDGDKSNNIVSNLEYCTYQENTIHYYSNNDKPKIDFYSEDIIKMYLNGNSINEISRHYPYHSRTVKSLLKRNGVKFRKNQQERKVEI
ncbi:TPA: HNH endonuclease [Staphylococcus aureus]|nr:HNH endonuclease [Staphylococcus aureus]